MRGPRRVVALTLCAALALLPPLGMAYHPTAETYRIDVEPNYRPASASVEVLIIPPGHGAILTGGVPPAGEFSPLDNSYLDAVYDSVTDLWRAWVAQGSLLTGRAGIDARVVGIHPLSPIFLQDIEILIVADEYKGGLNAPWRETNQLAHANPPINGVPCVIDNSNLAIFSVPANDIYNTNMIGLGKCLGLDGDGLHPTSDGFEWGYSESPIIPGAPAPVVARQCPSNLDVKGLEAAFSRLIAVIPDADFATVPVSSYAKYNCVPIGV